MAGKTAVVLGEKLRVTRTNFCGTPVEGAANRHVLEAYVRFNMTPETKAREDLETTSASGKVCVSTSIPEERKWWNLEIEVCDADPDLFSLLAQYAKVIDPDGNPIGFYDRARPDTDYGVMLEVWTGGESQDDCPVPTSDAVFSSPSSGRNWGYFAIGGRQFSLGGISIEANPTTFTLSGRSYAPKGWARGPYNVANTAALGDPVEAGRLLVPMYRPTEENHFLFFKTPIEPPEVTDGAVPLVITGTGYFEDPDFYYDGPGQVSADVAPDQADTVGDGYVIAETGTPAGGSIVVVVEYPEGPDENVTIPYNSTHAAAKALFVAVDDDYPASAWASSGGTLPGTSITIVPPVGVTLKKGANNLTGGTSPDFTVTPA